MRIDYFEHSCGHLLDSDDATKALGPITAVIANAGIVAPTAKLVEMSAERMRRTGGTSRAARLCSTD